MLPVFGRKTWVHAMCVKWIAGAMMVGSAVEIAKPAEAVEDELFCVCRKPYQDGVLMVGCDDCNGWFHPGCIGMSPEQAQAVTFYQCPNCSLDESQVETNQHVEADHGVHAEADQLLQPATKKQKTEQRPKKQKGSFSAERGSCPRGRSQEPRDCADPVTKKQKINQDASDDGDAELIDSDEDEEM